MSGTSGAGGGPAVPQDIIDGVKQGKKLIQARDLQRAYHRVGVIDHDWQWLASPLRSQRNVD